MSTTADADVFENRQRNLAAVVHEAGLDAAALNPGPTLFYFTGMEFHLSERPILALFGAEGEPTVVLPELEVQKAEDRPYALNVITYPEDPSNWPEAFERGAKTAGLKGSGRVGVEPRRMRILERDMLAGALPEVEFVSAEEHIASLRMHKDGEEIAAMRAAVEAAEKAMQATLPGIQAGTSEKELAAELTNQVFRHGSNPQLPFTPIVSTGPNSANPHAMPSERKLAEGDLLVIDWGANVDGYFSDITRAFAVGEVEEEFIEIHRIVQEANAAARDMAAPGVPCARLDEAARKVIEAAGYGEYFIHRTGHGLGLEGHEEPYIRSDNTMPLGAGMTFTIEPGIYLPERGGVRIEDDVVVTEDGLESLTSLPRELIVVGG